MRFNLETTRLRLRNITPDDWEAAFKWCSDPDVARYMPYTAYTNPEDVETLWLDKLNLDDPDSYDAGIVLKSTGELIGYNLRKDQWGHGYAGETIRGLMEHVRKYRPVRGIRGTFAAENSKSRRVMEKLGMTYCGEATITKFDGSETLPAKEYRRIF